MDPTLYNLPIFGPSSANPVPDIIDLNDIFTDDYYPQELEFNDILFELSSNSFMDQHSVTGDVEDTQSDDTPLLEANDTVIIPPVPFARHTESNSSSFAPGTRAVPQTKSKTSRSRAARDSDSDDFDSDEDGEGKRVRVQLNSGDLNRHERRERNREHAKKSRIRKKLMLDTLQDQLDSLRGINIKLRNVVSEKLPGNVAAKIFHECTTAESDLLKETTINLANNQPTATGIGTGATQSKPTTIPKFLVESDFRLIQALQHSQQNFVITDPTLPDNPIVYCSEGFCKLTQYKRYEVLGRNCRFLQGPRTDQNAVSKIRQGITEGKDVTVCLLNYKADNTPFWNQFFVASLRDDNEKVINHVGVQCEVNSLPISKIKDQVKKLPLS